jgi:hypothetical protein
VGFRNMQEKLENNILLTTAETKTWTMDGKCKIFLFLSVTFHIYVNWFITDPTFPTFDMGNHSNWWADIPFTRVN